MTYELEVRTRQLSDGLPLEKDKRDLSQLILELKEAEVPLEPTETSSSVIAAGVAVRGRRKALELKPGDHDPPAVLRICGKNKRLQLYVRWGLEYGEVQSGLARLVRPGCTSKLKNAQGAFLKMEGFRVTMRELAEFFKRISELT